MITNNNLMRNVLTQLTSALSDSAFAAIVAVNNLPAGLTLSLAQSVAKGTIQSVMQNCYDDVQSMNLSKREVAKHNLVFDVAVRTYLELTANDSGNGAQYDIVLEDAYYQELLESAEHISLEAIRQSEEKKIKVLGRYYGGEFYKHGPNIDIQNMHQMITMVGMLTFRQIVLIRLITEGFKGLDMNLFIHNPFVCVEINRLRDYGIWLTEGASFGIDESGEIQLKSIIPSRYSEIVYEALMLERLSDDDVQRTIDSLDLKKEGTPQPMLTEENYKAQTTWRVEGETLFLPDGKRFGKDENDDMFLVDLAKGK